MDRLSWQTISKETEGLDNNIDEMDLSFLIKKSPGPDGVTGEFCPTFKAELIPIFIPFQNTEEKGTLPNFMRPAYPDTKVRQEYYKERTQAEMHHEHGCKHLQQNSSSPNSTAY